ncbi:MAG: DEAD/DEAH box helicase family protein [Gammaproteobacteria bacterium]
MLESLRGCKEDWEDGFHPVLKIVTARESIKIPKDELAELDDNIHTDLQKINANRKEPISLKYFQYLATLSIEYFLHRQSSGPGQLLQELQDFAEDMGSHRYPAPESIDDLKKLALWMATGAGKTLLMHLNYHQFLRRRHELFAPDNIILLTPNETLSTQHLEEMRESGIACFRHGEAVGGLGLEGEWPVRVLELTKLTADRSGKVTVPTSEFEGRNLVLVDEGHKGTGGEAWLARRDELAEDGFVFEYSATYGQAFARTGKAEDRADEYARSIAFDYSYRHFHGDGYGKDFDVVNLSGDPEEERRDVLMLGNLLVFLQQRVCFAIGREQFAQHNLESPLLLLLGARVSGGQGRTDIVDYLRFLHRVALDSDWAKASVKEILQGKTGIEDDWGQDVFKGRLDWLNKQFGGANRKLANPTKIYRDLLHHVFRVESSGKLQFCPIPGTKGEVALRVSAGEPFGLVYVGNDAIKNLQELLQDECPDIQVFDETVIEPQFHKVANASSLINLLIGAKKFMEGWSSWRVSGMGLLNVGQSEGPQIIQLFGRGVRLKGANMSLKRGGGDNPLPELPILETMNIFGIRANFIGNFRKMLEAEGVWEDELLLPISPPLPEAMESNLLVPEYPAAGFEEPVALIADERLRVELDISSAALRVASRGDDTDQDQATPPHAKAEGSPLSEAALQWIDWDDLIRKLREYRVRANMWNLTVSLDHMEGILNSCCGVVCDASAPLEPTSTDNIKRIRNTAFALLRKYTERFYNKRRSEWSRSNISYRKLDTDHFVLPQQQTGYVLSFKHISGAAGKEREKLIDQLRELVDNEKQLKHMWETDSDNWQDPPPRIYLDNHLYQPLLLAKKLEEKGIRVSPYGLNEGEMSFIKDLRQHLKQNPPPKGTEVYLLRNQSSAGVGLLDDAGSTFPDFILWIKQGDEQRIVFVEPHGMLHAPAYNNDPKAHLHETLSSINEQLKDEQPHIKLDSYVISQTRYDDLHPRYGEGDWQREQFRDKHILFPQDDDYIESLFKRPSCCENNESL